MRYQSRCIIVLSLPRSGSSCVAGLLHRLGVDMGSGHLQPPDALNPRGYYEDERWKRINNATAGRRYEIKEPISISERYKRQYQKLAQQRSKFPVWGFKNPRACFTLQYITPLLKATGVEPRLIAVERNPIAVQMSLMRHSQLAYRGQFEMAEDEACALLDDWRITYERRLEEFDGPTFHVNYEDLLDEPCPRVKALANFCYADIENAPGDAQMHDALEWLAPELNHYANDDHHPDAGRADGSPNSEDSAAPGWHAKRKRAGCNCGR